jgi:hypothetical protein
MIFEHIDRPGFIIEQLKCLAGDVCYYFLQIRIGYDYSTANIQTFPTSTKTLRGPAHGPSSSLGFIPSLVNSMHFFVPLNHT